MIINWRRGLTRSYIVLWAAWLVYIPIRAISIFNPILTLAALTAIVLAGVVVPAILFLALRWIFNGFHQAADS